MPPTRSTTLVASFRHRSVRGSSVMTSGQILEQPGLEVAGANPSRRGDQRLDLASANEPLAAELDARELADPRPTPDRLGPEVDVRGREELRRLLQADPV